MAYLPKLDWRVRVAALVVAFGLSLYVVEVYNFGVRFSALVANLGTVGQAPPAPAKPKPPVFSDEPGIVPVLILPEKPAKP
jgi:hypothetical protein